MGVRGLTTYISYNEDLFLRDFVLHSNYLVIDGHSLCAQMYQRLTSNSAFGGDYDKYSSFIRKFFLDLRRCKITPVVLFDGSLERKKLRTAFSRLRSKLNGVIRLYPGNQSSLKIFPLLLRDVFKEVLVELNILHTVCEFEADDEIAIVARHLCCPVLSYDSDFFIYNVQYVPFNTVNIKPVLKEKDDVKYYGIECKVFHVEYFTEQFEGFHLELLPILATLLGNDYVKKKVFKNFFAHLKLPKSRKKKNEQQRSIQAVIEWLRNETLDSAVQKIIGRLRGFQKQHVLNILRKSCEGYTKTNCASLKYLNLVSTDEEEQPGSSIFDEILETSDGSSSEIENEDSSSDESSEASSVVEDVETKALSDTELPAWIVNGIRRGVIPQPYINLYTHQLYFVIPQAEDCNEKDVFLICLPLLRYAFDILTNFSNGTLTYVSREGSQLKKIDVSSDISVGAPYHTETSPLESKEITQYFVHFFDKIMPGIEWKYIDEAPSGVRITLVALLFWAKHSNVTSAQVYSVLLCYIMLAVVDEKTGTPRNDFFFKNRHAKILEEIKTSKQNSQLNFEESELFLNKNKVAYEDCLITASVMIKLFEMETELKNRPKTYNLHQIHGFAQFQCCLQQVNYLNTLCDKKYEPAIIHKTYTGLLAYNLLNKLSNRSDPMAFVEQYLKGADTVLLLFKSLCHLIDKCLSKIDVTLATSAAKVKRRSRRKKGKDISFLCEGFESEVII